MNSTGIFTAISTILGAVLFLRFGYAVGTLGFIGVVFIILLAHTVTIPTSLALSEIATNKRVEGGESITLFHALWLEYRSHNRNITFYRKPLA